MQKKIALVLLLSIFLIACGSRTGTRHPSKDQSEWGTDHAECERIVRDGVRPNPEAYDTATEMRLIKTCMQKKGWRQ